MPAACIGVAVAASAGSALAACSRMPLLHRMGRSENLDTSEAAAAVPPHPDEGPKGSVPPPPPKSNTLRHAEKSRTSTCPFADRIATAVIAEYERRRPASWQHQQTVLAGFVAHRKSGAARVRQGSVMDQCPCTCFSFLPHCFKSLAATRPPSGSTFPAAADGLEGEFCVLAFGLGTKFLGASMMAGAAGNGDAVRDMHAEVLARRAFVRFLHEDVRRVAKGGLGELLERRGDSFGMRRDTTLHFYTSSVPCGNASWKRWAKGGSEYSTKASAAAADVSRRDERGNSAFL
eukprot:gnl/TRDRNA2_/TRDRNA2_133701_c0_seq1.p2 gnl/TRDRNA2_/TRDRNA2_133701_c0~~gnl/TRDRNA2_/TRDRNA2_133701_c0_seq1.p2  ORF type:complete len:290 (+),score=43.13 gnl/TRDRNA2_/TRDRNA2_133701_c0_seq1:66-935(+)